MQEYLLNEEAQDKIYETFKLLHDLVTPTMGARGRTACIDSPFGQPNITDDGVTVVKALNNLSGWDKVIGKSVIEGARVTESNAFDGTTLTILLTFRIYEYGYNLIKEGMAPRIVVDRIVKEINVIKERLNDQVIEMSEEFVEAIATIATKDPIFGKIMKQTYDMIGSSMDAIVKWDRSSNKTVVEHTPGYTFAGGYAIDDLKGLPKEFSNAKIALMKTGLNTEFAIKKWIDSIPEDASTAIVYAVAPGFNPEGMRRIIQFHTKTGIPFNFCFINSTDVNDVFRDLSIIGEGSVQDTTTGIKNYEYKHCATADHIKIEKFKSTIIAKGDTSERIKEYEEALKAIKYQDSNAKIQIETKLASLKHGIATISIGVPTHPAFSKIKLKLDDAMGAVYKSFQDGIIPGAGKPLMEISKDLDMKHVMEQPYKTILLNAGVDTPTDLSENEAIDVTTLEKVNLIDAKIVDSKASIEQALTNATSIACEYLTTYLLIKNKEATS